MKDNWEHEINLIEKPLLIMCNPEVENYIKNQLGTTTSKRLVFHTDSSITTNKCYIFDRKKIEDAYLGMGVFDEILL